MLSFLVKSYFLAIRVVVKAMWFLVQKYKMFSVVVFRGSLKKGRLCVARVFANMSAYWIGRTNIVAWHLFDDMVGTVDAHECTVPVAVYNNIISFMYSAQIAVRCELCKTIYAATSCFFRPREQLLNPFGASKTRTASCFIPPLLFPCATKKYAP